MELELAAAGGQGWPSVHKYRDSQVHSDHCPQIFWRCFVVELKLNAWQVLRGLPMLPKSDLGAKVLTCCLRGEFWGVDTVSVQGLLKRAHSRHIPAFILRSSEKAISFKKIGGQSAASAASRGWEAGS